MSWVDLLISLYLSRDVDVYPPISLILLFLILIQSFYWTSSSSSLDNSWPWQNISISVSLEILFSMSEKQTTTNFFHFIVFCLMSQSHNDYDTDTLHNTDWDVCFLARRMILLSLSYFYITLIKHTYPLYEYILIVSRLLMVKNNELIFLLKLKI